MKTESAFLISGLTFLIFRFWPWPGGAEMEMIVLSLLASLYLFGAYYFFSDRSTSNQNIPLSIAGGIALSTVVTGFLFKILYLSGSKEMLIIGLPATFIVLGLTFYLRNSRANKESTQDLTRYYSNMIFRLTLWLFLGTAAFFIPEESLIKFTYRRDPDLATLQLLRHNATTGEEADKYENLIREHLSKKAANE